MAGSDVTNRKAGPEEFGPSSSYSGARRNKASVDDLVSYFKQRLGGEGNYTIDDVNRLYKKMMRNATIPGVDGTPGEVMPKSWKHIPNATKAFRVIANELINNGDVDSEDGVSEWTPPDYQKFDKAMIKGVRRNGIDLDGY